MKEIKLIVSKWCPHCMYAKFLINKLKKDEKYKKIKLAIIDDKNNYLITKNYDYYYVPAFFLDEQKYYEGTVNDLIIRKLFDEALDETV